MTDNSQTLPFDFNHFPENYARILCVLPLRAHAIAAEKLAEEYRVRGYAQEAYLMGTIASQLRQRMEVAAAARDAMERRSHE